MREVLDVIVFLLIPAGLLPVATFLVLFGYRGHPSPAARDRWHVSIAMAALGATTTFLAVNWTFDWGFASEWVLLPFALALLFADLVSGKWLVDFYSGSFEGRSDHYETAIEREDRTVGDKRRDLQAKARAAEDEAKAANGDDES